MTLCVILRTIVHSPNYVRSSYGQICLLNSFSRFDFCALLYYVVIVGSILSTVTLDIDTTSATLTLAVELMRYTLMQM